MLVKQVEDNRRICITTELYADSHTVTVGLITDLSDTVNLFILNKLCNLLDKTGLVYQIRKLLHLYDC